MYRLCRGSLSAFLVACILASAAPALAIPYFARKFQTSCTTCHSVVPKLNQTGLSFRARGYRLPGREPKATLPLAVWVGGGYENRPDANVDATFVDKVELISGGAIGTRASYFAEWRVVSLGLQDNGELSDRSGRFEDLFVSLDLIKDIVLTLGQFRLFNQFDNSLRLSASTPLALGAGIPGKPRSSDSSREAGLRGFSPVGRSPAAMLTYHIPQESSGTAITNGLYLHASVPLPGEFSIPLTDEARERASFEFDARPKGIYLESYYRRGLSSFGGAVFVRGGRQLYTGLASLDKGNWNTTLAMSSGVVDGDSDRRTSWWSEYQPRAGLAVGFRLDESSVGPTAYHLYGDLQFFWRHSVFWLLAELRLRDDSDRVMLQINAVF